MRRLVLAILGLTLLSGCGSTPAYTAQDLREVKHLYAVLTPIYGRFRAAFYSNDFLGMRAAFGQERTACKQVDAIDNRDNIDPNSNLFQASGDVDTLCNEIESAYARWRKSHHLKYDKTVYLPQTFELFKGSEAVLLQMPKLMCHPADVLVTLPTPPPTPNPTERAVELGQVIPPVDCTPLKLTAVP